MVKDLFAHRPYWAKRFGTAPVLPMSRAEMEELGWDSCDVVLCTGDAYVDHPSFGMALIGRLLEAHGFRVGIIAQPAWHDCHDFQQLGRPNLFFGITAGNMDSMVNLYTAERKVRSTDAYTPGGVAGKRPPRAALVYSNRCRQAFPDVPQVLGGIEASLRRVAHYDYWSDKVRRSLLVDAPADLLLYGNAERAVVEVAHRLAAREPVQEITDVRGTAFVLRDGAAPQRAEEMGAAPSNAAYTYLELPSYEAICRNRTLYAQAARLVHLETNPANARGLRQQHGTACVYINPPPVALATAELDRVYEFPYTRLPHPHYGQAKIPAYEMIQNSVTIVRGCFGGCSFCSIAAHEGRVTQSRSEASILREIAVVRDHNPHFTGIISDLGGPTANMYRMGCSDARAAQACRRLSCLYPHICGRLRTDAGPLIALYRQARSLPGIKKVLIGSGVRYDLALHSPQYIQELVQHHVGGYLKIAPEHTEPGPLAHMMKPGIKTFTHFAQLFAHHCAQAGKEQYLIPYFIAAHPGTTTADMVQLALWLKQHKFRPDQVQTFLPSPMSLATAMYYSGKNPLQRLTPNGGADVFVAKDAATRQLHKALLRYHDRSQSALLRTALRAMGRGDLIGPSKKHLIAAH